MKNYHDYDTIFGIFRSLIGSLQLKLQIQQPLEDIPLQPQVEMYGEQNSASFYKVGDVFKAGFLKLVDNIDGSDIYSIDEYVGIQDINMKAYSTINGQQLIDAVDPKGDHSDLRVRFQDRTFYLEDGHFTQQNDRGYTPILTYDELKDLKFINDGSGKTQHIEVQMWDSNNFMHYYTPINDDFYKIDINTIDIVGVNTANDVIYI